jgi:hypothetical protein
MIDYINVRGVFEDPLDLAKFQCNDGSSCFSLDDRYPIKSWMIPYIREQVINSLGIPLKTGKDTANDANEKATQ